MGPMHAGLLLLLLASASGQLGRLIKDPEAEWEKMSSMTDEMGEGSATAIGRGMPGRGPVIMDKQSFPPYKHVSLSKYPTRPFKPSLDGVKPLPPFAKDLLIVPSRLATGSPGPSSTSPTRELVEILCHDDRIYVRIVRSVFGRRNAYKDLKLGKCPVNQGTLLHYYFLYYLKEDCGFKLQGQPDFVSLSNVLRFLPTGPVVWETPFDVLLQCKYPRAFLSYKIGFHPKLQGGTVFKALTPKQAVISAVDVLGAALTGVRTYNLGQLMYFEVKKANDTANTNSQKLYINNCFATANRNPNSTPMYPLIENQGCMTFSKESAQSRFLTSSPTSQRFSLIAFTFNNGDSTSSKTKELHLHCSVSIGSFTPSPSHKACTYDQRAKMWRELYGNDDLCKCCDTTCPTAQPRASRNTISGPSWKVDLSDHEKDAEPWLRPTYTFNSENAEKEDDDFTNLWEDYE